MPSSSMDAPVFSIVVGLWVPPHSVDVEWLMLYGGCAGPFVCVLGVEYLVMWVF